MQRAKVDVSHYSISQNDVARAATSNVCREAPAAKYVLYSREQQGMAQHMG